MIESGRWSFGVLASDICCTVAERKSNPDRRHRRAIFISDYI